MLERYAIEVSRAFVNVGRCSMAVATSTLLGRPLWYELMTSDMKAAEAFYKSVVGWKTEPFAGAGQPYTAFNRSGDVSVGGVMTKPAEVKASPFWACTSGCRTSMRLWPRSRSSAAAPTPR
jgi:hypothetical protein